MRFWKLTRRGACGCAGRHALDRVETLDVCRCRYGADHEVRVWGPLQGYVVAGGAGDR